MDEQERQRFQQAVQRKSREAKAASENSARPPDSPSPVSGDEQTLTEPGRPQDTMDPRRKNTGHGKKTADKWNQ